MNEKSPKRENETGTMVKAQGSAKCLCQGASTGVSKMALEAVFRDVQLYAVTSRVSVGGMRAQVCECLSAHVWLHV